MAKKSETLRQREKAQKDLLELKKAKQGLLELKEAEEKQVKTPRTFKEKKDNFFYHHKVAFYAVIILLAVLIFLVTDSLTKTKYDTNAVLFTHEYYYEEQTAALKEILAEFCEDVDKNGEVNVSLLDCSYNENSAGYEYQQSQRGKVQARIASGNAMLFLLDEKTYSDLMSNLDYELFKEENRVNITPLLKASLKESENKNTPLPEGELFLCLREIKGSTAENKTQDYNNAKALLEKIKNAVK